MTWPTTSRHQRGYGTQWVKTRAHVLSKEPLCRQCTKAGKVRAATNVDHILPKAKGGTDKLENLQPLCNPHRAIKDAIDAGQTPKQTIGADGYPVGG